MLPAASVSRSHDRVAERGPYVQVNHPSSQTSSSSVHFSSLNPGIPMCGPTPMPRERSSINSAAGRFIPRSPGGLNQGLFVSRPPGWCEQGLAWWQLVPQQMPLPLQAWPLQLGCQGWSHGFAPHVLDQPSARAESKHGPAGGVSGVQPKGCGPQREVLALGLRPCSHWTLF